MKRISFVVAALVSLFAGVSCQKEEVTNLSQETGVVPFILNASIPETKTTMDETWSVEWVDGDVIYAVTTDAEWGVAYAEDNGGESIADFTCEGDSFTTTKTISEGEHTFIFLYTRKNQRSYHRGASTTIVLPNTQNIDLDSPRDSIHLYDALAGQYTATVGTSVSVATVSMKHLFSMMKVTLNNQSGASIDVKSFEFRVPGKDVTGVFNIAFSADNAHVASTATKYSDAVKVSVSKNGSIAAGASKDVYFVLPPISGFTGDVEMKVTTADEKTFTRIISVSNLSFTAGKYTTGSFKLVNADAAPMAVFTISNLATANKWANGVAYPSIISDDNNNENVKITVAEVGNNAKYYTSDNTYRMYNGGSLTVSGGNPNLEIQRIVINSDAANSISVSGNGKWNNGEWSGASNAVTFSFSGPTKIQSIYVWGIEKLSQSVFFDTAEKTVNLGETYTQVVSGAMTSVEYSSSDNSIASVDNNGVVTTKKTGKVTITATAAANEAYISSSASYSLIIIDPTISTETISWEDITTTSYSADETTFTKNGVVFGYVNSMRNNSNGTPSGWAKNQVIQLKSSAGQLYNKTSKPISSLRVYLASNTNSFTIRYGSTSECSDGSINRPTTSSGQERFEYVSYVDKTTGTGSADLNYYDFDFSGQNVLYFRIDNGSNVIYIQRLEISYK